MTFGKIDDTRGRSCVIYGPGGVGKTTLACLAPGPIGFFDLDNSLGVLQGQLPNGLDIRTVQADSWQAMHDALHLPGWDDIRTIVIDSATKAEELAELWMFDNVKAEKNPNPQRIEDYGYGKGYRHLYDTFLSILSDLDVHLRAGRNVILVAHEATEKHPNPQGDDWLRAEPRLQQTPKASIRERVRDWCDHMIYIGFDVAVDKGKGSGSGTRTAWPVELPHCMAKSRLLADPFEVVKNDATLWSLLFGRKEDD